MYPDDLLIWEPSTAILTASAVSPVLPHSIHNNQGSQGSSLQESVLKVCLPTLILKDSGDKVHNLIHNPAGCISKPDSQRRPPIPLGSFSDLRADTRQPLTPTRLVFLAQSKQDDEKSLNSHASCKTVW